MRKFLTVAVILALCSGVAMAHHVGAYADDHGLDCTLNVPAGFPTPNNFYLIHKQNPGGQGSQFKVGDAGLTAGGFIRSGQSSPYLTLGNWFGESGFADITITYGGCVIGDTVVGTLVYFYGFGTQTCNTKLEVLPSPTKGGVYFVTCDFFQVPGSGGRAFAGAGADDCPEGCNEPLATSETTWGSIKALYR
jgi:hypothetical protein